MENKNIYLLRGVSGSGKSTLAGALGGVNYEADQLFTIPEGEYKYNHLLIQQAHEACLYKTRSSMICGEPIIVVSNTFTESWELEPYIKAAEEFGYKLTSIVVEKRHKNPNKWGVSDKTINKMEQRLRNNLKLK